MCFLFLKAFLFHNTLSFLETPFLSTIFQNHFLSFFAASFLQIEFILENFLKIVST